MTILPKRNKRRLEARDDSAQHNVGSSNQDLQTINHSVPVQLQLQVDLDQSRRSHGHTHSHSHQPGHSVGHSSQHQSHSRYNQPVYHNLLHRTDNTHVKPPGGGGNECGKWKRSPPLRGSSSDDHVPPKKSKRACSKSKHSHHKTIDKQVFPHCVTQPSTSSYATLLPKATAAVGGSKSMQTLIPPTSTMATLLSPKMPGGAQDTFGMGRNGQMDGQQASSDEECKSSPPSPGGCNSEDEHMPSLQPTQYSEELERTFELALKKELGLEIKQMEMDGSCLFRAIADQVYGDQEMHDVIRNHCIDYMAKNQDHFSHYVTEDFDTYLQRKRQLGCHGNHMEVQALSEMYNRPIEVYQYSLKPINIFHSSYSAESAFPIRLSYHRNNHYNSLVDPDKPTIGVGLGLPEFKPRMVEQNLLTAVKADSENYQIEQTMLSDKLRETDWELTDEAIQEQVARESYLQWLEDRQKRTRQPPACTVTGPSCSSGAQPNPTDWVQPHQSVMLPKHPSSPPLSTAAATSDQRKLRGSKSGATGSMSTSLYDCPPSSSSAVNLATPDNSATLTHMDALNVYGYNGDIDENDAIARAIAESQKDFIQQAFSNKK